MSALWPTGSTSQPPITDGYGPRTGIEGARAFHYGVDIPMPLDSKVHAARDGVVVFAGENGSLGMQVVIDDGRFQFLTSHQRVNLLVSNGQRVTQGQAIARVGMTGLTTGPHTCFRTFEGSWRLDEKARNPVDVMALYNVGTAGGGGVPSPINRRSGKVEFVVKAPSGTIVHLFAGGKFNFTSVEQYNDTKQDIEFIKERGGTNAMSLPRIQDVVGVSWEDFAKLCDYVGAPRA